MGKYLEATPKQRPKRKHTAIDLTMEVEETIAAASSSEMQQREEAKAAFLAAQAAALALGEQELPTNFAPQGRRCYWKVMMNMSDEEAARRYSETATSSGAASSGHDNPAHGSCGAQ